MKVTREKIEKLYKLAEESLGNIFELIDSDLDREFEDERDAILIAIDDLKLSQQPTLDSDIEEALEKLGNIRLEKPLAKYYRKHFNLIKQHIAELERKKGFYMRAEQIKRFELNKIRGVVEKLKKDVISSPPTLTQIYVSTILENLESILGVDNNDR